MKPTITNIRVLQEPHAHCELFLNGEPFVVIHAELIVKFGLRVGLAIETQVIEKLIAADEVMRAKNHAINLIREEEGTSRVRSKRDIAQLLEQEGFDTEAVETAIAELIRSRHIRDRKFAENWVRRRQKSNPRGKTVLKRELVDKGVDKETAEKVVAEVETEDEMALAVQLARKRAKHYQRLPLPTAKRRLYGFLARRGFNSETIRQVLEQVFENEKVKTD